MHVCLTYHGSLWEATSPGKRGGRFPELVKLRSNDEGCAQALGGRLAPGPTTVVSPSSMKSPLPGKEGSVDLVALIFWIRPGRTFGPALRRIGHWDPSLLPAVGFFGPTPLMDLTCAPARESDSREDASRRMGACEVFGLSLLTPPEVSHLRSDQGE